MEQFFQGFLRTFKDVGILRSYPGTQSFYSLTLYLSKNTVLTSQSWIYIGSLSSLTGFGFLHELFPELGFLIEVHQGVREADWSPPVTLHGDQTGVGHTEMNGFFWSIGNLESDLKTELIQPNPTLTVLNLYVHTKVLKRKLKHPLKALNQHGSLTMATWGG